MTSKVSKYVWTPMKRQALLLDKQTVTVNMMPPACPAEPELLGDTRK